MLVDVGTPFVLTASALSAPSPAALYRRCLEKLLEYRPSAEKFPIVVSQVRSRPKLLFPSCKRVLTSSLYQFPSSKGLPPRGHSRCDQELC